MTEKIDRRKTPEFAEASRLRALRTMSHPKHRRAASARMKALFERPGFAETHRARVKTQMESLYADAEQGPKRKAKAGEIMRKLSSGPARAAEHSKRSQQMMQTLNADPEFRTASSARMRERHAKGDPTVDPAKARSQKKPKWHVPLGYEKLHEKYRKILGSKRAREEIKKLIEKNPLLIKTPSS
ncbi:MAG: hypothetical protein AAB573_03985 [Patescibacteria group bacterium]